MLLVHFKSRDLTRLQKQGQFWHIFFTHGGVIISQDEVDTWTSHLPISLDEDIDKIDAKEAIYKVLGGHTGPFPIAVDEVLVKSSWRPNLVVADDYRSNGGRVFLAGDSAHQNIPTGGYGMNMGVGDAYDIGWKLAAVLNGYGGDYLLQSYSFERRPVALRNVERSGVHHSVHGTYCQWVAEKGAEVVLSDTEDSKELKSRIREYVASHDGENQDQGIEMGYTFADSPVIIQDGSKENEWNPRRYVPSTRPGTRAPHVFLSDRKTSIFDLYGEDYTIVDFTSEGSISKTFQDVAKDLNVPLHRVHLPSERHVRSIWERDIVLVRPDGFVSWRSADPTEDLSNSPQTIHSILKIAVGKMAGDHFQDANAKEHSKSTRFTASVGNVEQDAGALEKMASFQKAEDDVYVAGPQAA